MSGPCFRHETESARCIDSHTDMESATDVERAKADDVCTAMPQLNKSSQDSPVLSDVDTQQSILGQFPLLDKLFVQLLC